jgi:hypothetical protein
MFTVVAFVFLARGGAQAATEQPPEGLAIEGKVLMVYSQGVDIKFAHIIEKASFKRLGNTMLLVGTQIDSGQSGDWLKGATVAVKWESVSRLIVIDSVEDLRRRSRNPNTEF